MAAKIKVGDKVEWKTSQGKTKGTVKKKLTAPTKIRTRKVAATKKNPEYLVESAKTGKKAAHKAEALTKAAKPAAKKAKPTEKGSAARKTSAAQNETAGSGSESNRTARPARSIPKGRKPAAAPAKTASKSTSAKSVKAKTAQSTNRKEKQAAKPAAKTPGKQSAKTSTAAKPGRTAAARKKAGTAAKVKTAAKKPGKTASQKTSAAKQPEKTAAKTAGRKAPSPPKAKLAAKDEAAIKDFREMVNLSADQLQRWLATKESKKVGFKDEKKGESVGHESGRRILKILEKRRDRYTDEDVKHMHRVVAFVKRHLAQKPKGDILASNWRYSLMNWGHDPAK